MLSLKERIELLENDLKQDPPGFTMSSDLPFAIFRYNPKLPDEGEWKMRKEIQNLSVRIENDTGRHVHILSMSTLFWQSIDQSEGLDTLVELERESGFEAAQDQVSVYLSDPDWRPLPALLVAHWITFREEQRLNWQKAYLKRLCETDPEIAHTYEQIQDFTTMLRERQGEQLDSWLKLVEEQGVSELQGFAQSLKKDYDAVKAGLTLEWSHDHVA